LGSNTVEDVLDDITGGKLVFDTGSSYGTPKVNITKLSAMMHNTNSETAWLNIGSSSAINSTQNLTANSTNNEVVIDKSHIISAYKSLNGILCRMWQSLFCFLFSVEPNCGVQSLVSKPETSAFFRQQYAQCSIRYGDLKKQLAEDIIQ